MRRLVLLIVAFLSIALPVAAQNPTNARDSVAAAMRAYVQVVRNSDGAGIMGWWADDGVYIAQGSKTTVGRTALDSVVRGIFATMRMTQVNEHTDEVMVDGNVALTRGVYSETLAPRSGTGAPVTLRGRYLFVWRRQAGGGWKIARGMTTDLPEPTKGH